MVERTNVRYTAVMAPTGNTWCNAEVVKYQRVAIDDMKISRSQDFELEKHERDAYCTSLHRVDHFRSLRKWKKPNMYIALLGAFGILLFLYWAIGLVGYLPTEPCESWQEGFHCEPNISQFWGQYSSYFATPSEISDEVPRECSITFAQILSRHGARDPTASKSATYNDTLQRIRYNTKSYTKQFKFIKDYEYSLGSDQLTNFGQQQMVNSGYKAYHRYRHLAREVVPFVRASGQDRVVESAQKWTQGFHQGRVRDNPDDNIPYKIVVISEAIGQNNTLDHGLCNMFESSNVGDEAQKTWIDVFTPPIVKRLNENMLGAEVDGFDAIHVMDLCPFETVASDIGRLSPFCYLFSEEEWQQYDYYQSLGKYYGFSWGNPLGATQGIGFTNELIARLTSTRVKDHTSTNRTLDGSNETFPIGGKSVLYADFSHDNDLTSIFSAMGLYNETKPLLNETLEGIKQTNGYSASWTVPFAARAYFEKMSCLGAPEEYVRIVVNDRVLPLKTCGGDEYGRCQLSAFLDSLSFAKDGGDWDECFR